MFIAVNEFLHFIYLCHSLASIMYRIDNATLEQAIECSHVVWDTRVIWDKNYEH